jgi:hypothetical protein
VIAALVALSAVLAAPTPVTPVRALAQQDQAAEAAQQLILPGAARAPDCGGKPELARIAFCVTAPVNTMNALGEAYMARLGEMGWLSADGRDNLVVFVRRRDGGGCDGLQMLAFYDETQAVTDQTPGYFALTTIPGDVCATVTTPTPETPPAETTPQ